MLRPSTGESQGGSGASPVTAALASLHAALALAISLRRSPTELSCPVARACGSAEPHEALAPPGGRAGPRSDSSASGHSHGQNTARDRQAPANRDPIRPRLAGLSRHATTSTSTTEHSLVGNLTCLRRVLIIKNEGMHHSPTIGLWCFWCSKELWAWRSSAEQGSRDSGFGWRWRKAEHHPARQRIADQLICRFMDV